jgi:hypothetical protein
MLAQTPVILIEVFRGFLQSLHGNSAMVPQSGHGRFFLNPCSSSFIRDHTVRCCMAVQSLAPPEREEELCSVRLGLRCRKRFIATSN